MTERARIARIQQIATEFDRRGWRDTGTDAQEIAGALTEGKSAHVAAGRASSQFLASNGISRRDIEASLKGLSQSDRTSEPTTLLGGAPRSTTALLPRLAALAVFVLVAAVLLLFNGDPNKDLLTRMISAGCYSAAIICVATALGLVLAGRLGRALGVLVAAATLAVVPSALATTTGERTVMPTPTPISPAASTSSPHSTPSAVATPSNRTLAIDVGQTGRSDEGLLVSVKAIELTEDLSQHVVSVAVGRPGYPAESFADLEVGDVIQYNADEAYEIRVLSISISEAEILVLQIP